MTQYVLSLSYGKDSLACLGAIEKLGLPLDRIIHAEVWATDDIPADLPPMIEFKKKADKIIKDRWGIEVEHIWATKRERERERRTYANTFYELHTRGKHIGQVRGFPMARGGWCQDRLKGNALDMCAKAYLRKDFLSSTQSETGGGTNLWIPNHQWTMVQQLTQETGDQIMGYATKWSQYCTGELKRTPLSTVFRGLRKWGELSGVRANSKSMESTPKRGSFLTAPGHNAQT